jgi:hypothetical protein
MEQHSIDLCLAIKESVIECIEYMAFMTVDTDCDPQASPPPEAGAVTARIEVLKPKAGELRLCMPRKTALEITKNLFCLPEHEVTDRIINDLACELLNTISGRVMKRVLPADCLYHLGIPSLAGQAEGALVPPFVSCRFTADGNLLAVAASIEV